MRCTRLGILYLPKCVGLFTLVDGIPTVLRIMDACEALDAFAKADPMKQVGVPKI